MKYNTKMAVMNLHKENMRHDEPGSRYEYTPPHSNYYDEPEGKFRDRKGREHYNSGRYAPMRNHWDHDDDMPRREYTPHRVGFEAPHENADEQRMGHLSIVRGGGELDEGMAEEWMAGLHNADGTTGPHWDKEQAKQIANQRRMNMTPIEAWVALNAVYSDYCKVAKAHNVNNMDFYVAMAKAFAEDEDAAPNKLYSYYKYIVK